MMDLGDNSVYKECAIICTGIYSDNEDKEIVVYRDQGISLTKYEEDMYGELMNTNSNEEKNINCPMHTRQCVIGKEVKTAEQGHTQ